MTKHPQGSYRGKGDLSKINESYNSDFRTKNYENTSYCDFDGIDDFKNFRSHFLSARAAARHGYHSKSHWKSQGRLVKNEASPVVCAHKTWKTKNTEDRDIILSFNKMNTYVVTSRRFCSETGSLGCWDVFKKDDTIPICEAKLCESKKEKSKEQKSSLTITNSSSSSTNSSLHSSPYDGGNTIKKTKRDGKRRSEETDSGGSRFRKVNKRKTAKPQSSCFVYFPETFDWTAHPKIEKFRSTFMWFAHLLYQRRFVNTERIFGKDEYVTVKAEFARNIAPKYRQMIKVLLEEEIVERVPYQIGVKSYGYRFVDRELRHSKRVRTRLEDAEIVRRLDEQRKKQATTRNDRWLRSQLFKLGLAEIDAVFLAKVAGTSVIENGGCIDDKLEAYHFVLERIANNEHRWKSDPQGRCYTLVTNLKRELRSLLRVEGRRLQYIDINNSQLTFLALEMKKQGVDCEDFTSYCEQGQLYEHVAKHARSNRSKVKKTITQKALFSPNSAKCQRSPIKRTFDKLFPVAARFIYDQKNAPEGHSTFAKMLQAAEADLIIKKVCGRLRLKTKIKFVTPVHDCLLFLPEDAETIKSVMSDEFQRIGLKPLLKVEDL